MSFFSSEPTKEPDQYDYEDEDYDQEDGRQNYLQNEEEFYNSDDPSENEYEMSQNEEGGQSRKYSDDYSAEGDARNSCDDDIAAEYREEDEQEVDLIDRKEELDPIIDIGPHLEQIDPDQGDNDSGDNNRVNKSPQPAEQSNLDPIINITSDIAQTGVSAVAVIPNKSRDGLTEDAQLHPKASSAEVGKDILATDQIEISELENADSQSQALLDRQPIAAPNSSTTNDSIANDHRKDTANRTILEGSTSEKQSSPNNLSAINSSPIDQNAQLNRASIQLPAAAAAAAKPPIAEARLGQRPRLIRGIADVNRPSLQNRAEATSQGLRRRFEGGSGFSAIQYARFDGDTSSSDRGSSLSRSASSAGSKSSPNQKEVSSPGSSVPPLDHSPSITTRSPAAPIPFAVAVMGGAPNRTLSESREAGPRPRDQDANTFQKRTMTEELTVTDADDSRTLQSALLSPQRTFMGLSNTSSPSAGPKIRSDDMRSENALMPRNALRSTYSEDSARQLQSNASRLTDTSASLSHDRDRDRDRSLKQPRPSSSSTPSRALQMSTKGVERPRVDITDIEAQIGDIISGTTKRLREIQQDCGSGSFVLVRDEPPAEGDTRLGSQGGEKGKRPRERDCNVPAFVAALEQDSFTLAKALCRLMKNDALLLAPQLFKNENALNLLRQQIDGIK